MDSSTIEDTNIFLFHVPEDGEFLGWAELIDGSGATVMTVELDATEKIYAGSEIEVNFPKPSSELQVHAAALYSWSGELLIMGWFNPFIWLGIRDTLTVYFKTRRWKID